MVLGKGTETEGRGEGLGFGNGTYAAILFDNGHRSIEAWYFMFSICFFSASRSMVARILGSIASGMLPREMEKKGALVCVYANRHLREGWFLSLCWLIDESGENYKQQSLETVFQTAPSCSINAPF